MIAYTFCAGTIRTAARLPCPSSGFPPTSCNTLGIRDLSLVPLPAAIIATATRGPEVAPDPYGEREDVRFSEGTPEAAEKEELPFDFFIRPNIPRARSNGYFPADALKSLPNNKRGQRQPASITERKHAQIRHRARYSGRRRCHAGP